MRWFVLRLRRLRRKDPRGRSCQWLPRKRRQWRRGRRFVGGVGGERLSFQKRKSSVQTVVHQGLRGWRALPPGRLNSKPEEKVPRRSNSQYKHCVTPVLLPCTYSLVASHSALPLSVVLLQVVGSGAVEKVPESWEWKFFTRIEGDSNQEDLNQGNRKQLQRSASICRKKTLGFGERIVVHLETAAVPSVLFALYRVVEMDWIDTVKPALPQPAFVRVYFLV